MLKLSVITVCLNSVETIEQTIRSVIMQDYGNIEYIIVDGGSQDGTLEIIRKYDNYLAGWISEPDKGIYDAMNKGIKMATGDIIAFLNSDDWYKENILQDIMEDIQNSKVSISCYDVDINEGTEIRRFRNGLAEQEDNIRICMIYSQPAIFTKRAIFDQYGNFDSRYKIAGDYEWLLRMYNNGVDIKYKHITVTNFRESGISSVQGLKALEEAKVVAVSALNSLFQEKKISKEYFERMHDRIVKYYEKSDLTYVVKSTVKAQLIMKDAWLKDVVKKNFLGHNVYSIFGCGFLGEECLLLLRQLEISVCNFWDNNSNKWGTFFKNIDVKSPQKIKKGESVIIVCSVHNSNDIRKQLCDMGLLEEIDFIDYNLIREKIGMMIRDRCSQGSS